MVNICAYYSRPTKIYEAKTDNIKEGNLTVIVVNIISLPKVNRKKFS